VRSAQVLGIAAVMPEWRAASWALARVAADGGEPRTSDTTIHTNPTQLYTPITC